MGMDGEELAGFSACTRAVNAAFGLEGRAALDRRTLNQWFRRGALNAAGDPPPRPVRADVAGPVLRRLLFRPSDWVAWVGAGIPVLVFETPEERLARVRREDTRLDKVKTRA